MAIRNSLSPSDLENATDGQHLLAGRVVHVSDDRFRLADAFASVEVRGRGDWDVGDLLTVSVRRVGELLELMAVIDRYRPVASSAEETERFIEGRLGINLLVRARIFSSIRGFFSHRRFVEVDTPLLVPSPGLDVHLDAIEAAGGYLITSPEYQMKRLLVGGFPRIFQLSHVFRRGEIGARHNPEFTMLEWYRAFADVEEVMRDTELLVTETTASCSPTGALAGEHGPITLAPPFERIPVADAFQRFAGVEPDDALAMAERDPDRYFRLLVERVEPALAKEPRPVFLIDFPISQASLARAKPGDPRVCERFELYAGGVELCNGFGELTDPVEQRRRLLADQDARRATGKPVYPIDERFLAALDQGMPPSAGNALGVDRLVALCLGEREIGRVMPFAAGQL